MECKMSLWPDSGNLVVCGSLSAYTQLRCAVCDILLICFRTLLGVLHFSAGYPLVCCLDKPHVSLRQLGLLRDIVGFCLAELLQNLFIFVDFAFCWRV